MTAGPPSELLGFVQRLRARYRSAGAMVGGEDPGVRLLSLALAEAALRRLDGGSQLDRRPAHIAVLGPTQAGKSTVVNLLLGEEAAAVSPLAGFTRHPHGFALNVDEEGLRSTRDFFRGWHELGVDPAPPEARVYSLRGVGGSQPLLAGAPCVVWDTPDFDSHDSRGYRESIAEVAALADVLLLVVSKEKYSDLSVWQTVAVLKPLGRPLLVCLNKVSQDLGRLRAALRGRIAQAGYDERAVPIYDLPYVGAPGDLRAPAGRLIQAVAASISTGRLGPEAHRAGVAALMAQYWDDWVAPVHEEIDCERRWAQMSEAGMAEAAADYRAQYLDHAQHYSTFSKSVVQLLELLEIPALARPLARARQALTWPFRRLLAGAAGRDRGSGKGLDAEGAILEEILNHALLGLGRRIGDAAGSDHAQRWWAALGRALGRREEAIRQEFVDAIPLYQQTFQAEIERAARELFERLKESPATLNGLRAARVAADASGVLLALKTGAIGVNEAVLTPAMLSLTSLLTEGAVGKYMDHVKEDLKARQIETVRRLLFEQRVLAALRALPSALGDETLLGIGEAELAVAVSGKEGLGE